MKRMDKDLQSEVMALVSRLSYEDLRITNRIIINRLSVIRELRCRHEAMKYMEGQTVRWNSKRGGPFLGVVERVNRKTLTIRENCYGDKWRVPYSLII